MNLPNPAKYWVGVLAINLWSEVYALGSTTGAVSRLNVVGYMLFCVALVGLVYYIEVGGRTEKRPSYIE